MLRAILAKHDSQRPSCHRLTSTLLLPTLILTLSACDGGGESSGSQPPPLTVPSELALAITFPIAHGDTGGQGELTISGTLRDIGDGTVTESDLTDLTVNGIRASVDYAQGRWHAVIPAETEDGLDISAIAEGASGQVAQASILVNNAPTPLDYHLLNVTADGASALVYGSGVLRNVHLTSGAESQIADGLISGTAPNTGIRTDASLTTAYLLREGYESTGDGYAVELDSGSGRSVGNLLPGNSEVTYFPGFDLDPTMQRLVYSAVTTDLHGISGHSCALMALSLESGEIELIADTDFVTAPTEASLETYCAGPLTVDAANNRVFVAAWPAQYSVDPPEHYGLYAYDLGTGVGQTISDARDNSGPLLYTPRWLFLNDAGDQVLSVDDDQIVWIDLDTGDRTLALDTPSLPERITDVDFDEPRQRLLIASERRSISSLSLADGRTETLLNFSHAVGTGPDIFINSRTAVDSHNNRIFVEGAGNNLLALDLGTLERYVFTRPLVPDSSWDGVTISALALDSQTDHLYLVDDNTRSVVEVDLASQMSRIVSSPSQGAGPQLFRAAGLSVDDANGLLYVTGTYPQGNGLLSIDIATGARKLIHETANVQTQHWATLMQSLYDPDNGRVIAVTRGGSIVAIDVLTGQRSLLVDGNDIPESQQGSPVSMAWDSTPGHVLVQFGQIVSSVDLATGTHSIVGRADSPVSYDPERAVIYSPQHSRTYLSGRYTSTVVAFERYTGASTVIARPE